MTTTSKLAALVAGGALALTPASALANGHGHGKPTTTPGHGQSATTPTHAQTKAYGRLCQTESKQHAAAEKGTAFSRCVVDMAQLAKHPAANPHAACANESKKHVKGEKGTAFSRCIVAANKLRQSQKSSTGQGS